MRLQDFAIRYTAAWCSQDPESVATFYSPGGSLRVNDGTPAVGRTEIAAVAQSFMTAFPDLQVYLDELRELPDHTEYHWTLSGTNTGPGGTGNRVNIRGLERWQMGDDHLIASSEGEFDVDDYTRQLKRGPLG